MKKNIVVFGLGKMFQMFLKIYDSEKVNILALCDNNPYLFRNQDKKFKVIEPKNIIEYDMDYILITCLYFEEIKEQLIGMGIKENKIIGFAEVYFKLTTTDVLAMEFLKDDLFIAMTAQNSYDHYFREIRIRQETILCLHAKTYIDSIKNRKLNTLEDAEFKVFSQNGEDGIIQWLINNVDLGREIFIEFGVEDYQESNTRFLLMNNNWSGLVIDGSEENVRKIKQWETYWKYDLNAVAGFITKDNINSIILKAGIEGDIGLLSVDIDGNDYWILDAINCVSPRILICEFNSIFGSDKIVTVPYDKNFVRTQKHYSNLYYGCSLGALCDWAEKKGFYYLGSNSTGNNAFFVRKDCFKQDKLPKERKVFVESKFRESRDENGGLTFIGGNERLKLIKEMQLLNLENGDINKIEEIYQI